MHHSRLSSILIDCRTDDFESAARFWSEALGRPFREGPNPGGAHYIALVTHEDEPVIEVQKVAHESRVHLDIESDDIEAEVRRLEALGARRIAAIKTWVVMEAPTGQRFCVVRPQRGDAVGPHANEWPIGGQRFHADERTDAVRDDALICIKRVRTPPVR